MNRNQLMAKLSRYTEESPIKITATNYGLFDTDFS